MGGIRNIKQSTIEISITDISKYTLNSEQIRASSHAPGLQFEKRNMTNRENLSHPSTDLAFINECISVDI